jgi:hypothetical protein
MQQRKEIYERALKKLDTSPFICIAISSQLRKDLRPSHIIALDFPEFMLFKPDGITTKSAWFDFKLEREICLDFCILFCNEKMFDNA